MGYKKLSNKEEKQLVEEYISGAAVNSLMKKYGFKTKKSITDKVKKHYPNEYKNLIKKAQNNRKSYDYCMDEIKNEFDAYFLGLLLTDGYISRDYDIGIDLIDEDCIAFLSKTIGKEYKTYKTTSSAMSNGYQVEGKHDRHRLIFSNAEMVEKIKRLGVTPNKTYNLQGPLLSQEEEKFIPYIIRGVIDGDGTVSPTSYGAPQFKITTKSESFADWLVYTLTNKMYMTDISKVKNNELWIIGTANQNNILKLISLSYNKPFGMSRKYKKIRKTFRDYNNDALLQE